MPTKIAEEDGGKTLVVHVSGTLTRTEYEHFVSMFERHVEKYGKLRLLFDMSGFTGWEPRVVWEDIKFGMKHSDDVERLAIVGAEEWQHALASIFKPFTKATVKYFDYSSVVVDAKTWLEAP
jgi:hypothetical protein